MRNACRLLLCTLIPFLTMAVAQAAETPRAVLWLGNSFFYYNNSLHNHVGQLARSAGLRLRGTSVTISGGGLDWHDIDSLLEPGRLGRYSLGKAQQVRFHPKGGAYDTTVMMDCSLCPVHPDLAPAFREAVRRHAMTLARHGIRPVLFMTWAYRDAPEMTEPLAAAYREAASRNGLAVIPAGLAFARVRNRHPGIELYGPDGRHPSLAGTYLAACTAFAQLTGRTPVGLDYSAGLPAETTRILQEAAWLTVSSSFRELH